MLKLTLFGLIAGIVVGCAESSSSHQTFELVQLSAAEDQGLRQSKFLKPEYPTYRATAQKDGVRRRIYLQYTSLGTTLSQYQVAVLSADGALIEETVIHVPEDYEPSYLLETSPLRVEFHDPKEQFRVYRGQAISSEQFSHLVSVYDEALGCIQEKARQAKHE